MIKNEFNQYTKHDVWDDTLTSEWWKELEYHNPWRAGEMAAIPPPNPDWHQSLDRKTQSPKRLENKRLSFNFSCSDWSSLTSLKSNHQVWPGSFPSLHQFLPELMLEAPVHSVFGPKGPERRPHNGPVQHLWSHRDDLDSLVSKGHLVQFVNLAASVSLLPAPTRWMVRGLE